ncbi:MAG: hypothetical protein ACYC0X_05985 [Pirellulaceae bacterium]
MRSLNDIITPAERDAWVLEIRHEIAAILKLGVHQTETLLREATPDELSAIHRCFLYPEVDRQQVVKLALAPVYERLAAA